MAWDGEAPRDALIQLLLAAKCPPSSVLCDLRPLLQPAPAPEPVC